MSTTQFAMVEELASLVKDNLRSKHLVLTMEESLIKFLEDQWEDNPSLDGVLELEPMDPYNRLLLHRLADIFGFAHASIGEGEDRHLLLERCPETAVPSILVSDILTQYDDEPQSFTAPLELLRRNSPTVSNSISPSLRTLQEREAVYVAARERIFAVDADELDEPLKHKPRSVPVVARRMIAHALGQKLQTMGIAATDCSLDTHTSKPNCDETRTVTKSGKDPSNHETVSPVCGGKPLGKDDEKPVALSGSGSNASPVRKHDPKVESSSNGGTRVSLKKDFSKEQQLGAAKRMFANALGLPSSKGGSPARLNKRNDGLCMS